MNKRLATLESDKKLNDELADTDELKEYKNFEQNKEKIAKVLEYRNKLKERIIGIDQLREGTRNQSKKLEQKEEELNEKNSQLEQKRADLESKKSIMKSNQEKYDNLQHEISTMEDSSAKSLKKAYLSVVYQALLSSQELISGLEKDISPERTPLSDTIIS